MVSFILPQKSKSNLSPRSIFIWRVVQSAVWLVGFAIFVSLIFFPKIGLVAFWNILIPVAPALLVVATGVWRNVCPLASTSLLSRHFNFSLKKKMTVSVQGKLQLLAVIALFVIIPLRHLVFNTNGMATAALLFAVAALSFVMGYIYDWKSAWCNSLCPISPVEKLYGNNTLLTVPNTHCDQCVNCSLPCPDSTPNFHPVISKKTSYNVISGILITGGLPGIIFGWFFVPDYSGPITFFHLIEAYKYPAVGLCISMYIYLCFKGFFTGKKERLLINCYAATAVSLYYWFRIPSLIGFGKFPDNVVLFNLAGVLPGWSVVLLSISSTLFFFWWIVIRKPNFKSWMIRPKYALRQRAVNARGQIN